MVAADIMIVVEKQLSRKIVYRTRNAQARMVHSPPISHAVFFLLGTTGGYNINMRAQDCGDTHTYVACGSIGFLSHKPECSGLATYVSLHERYRELTAAINVLGPSNGRQQRAETARSIRQHIDCPTLWEQSNDSDTSLEQQSHQPLKLVSCPLQRIVMLFCVCVIMCVARSWVSFLIAHIFFRCHILFIRTFNGMAHIVGKKDTHTHSRHRFYRASPTSHIYLRGCWSLGAWYGGRGRLNECIPG